MNKLLLIVALLSGNAFAINLGGLAAGYEGFQDGQRQGLLNQCMSSCSPGDGQCYQGCSSAYGPRQQPQQQQQWQQQEPFSQERINYQCMSNCESRNNPRDFCKSRCSY